MNNYELIKDKEQMARIIAFDLCKQSYHSNLYDNEAQCYSDNNFPDCKKIKAVVDKLYNANYHRVDKNVVVLTQEQYEELKKESAAIARDYQEMGQFYDEKCEELEKLIQEKHTWTEQVRKDTAKDILDKVSRHYGGAWLVELYKEYGLEVE